MDLLNNGLGTDCVIRIPNPDHMFWLIVPAVVLTGGVRLWPDKLAVNLICCANTGIDIIDMDNIQRETIGMYLPKRSSSNHLIFRDI